MKKCILPSHTERSHLRFCSIWTKSANPQLDATSVAEKCFKGSIEEKIYFHLL